MRTNKLLHMYSLGSSIWITPRLAELSTRLFDGRTVLASLQCTSVGDNPSVKTRWDISTSWINSQALLLHLGLVSGDSVSRCLKLARRHIRRFHFIAADKVTTSFSFFPTVWRRAFDGYHVQTRSFVFRNCRHEYSATFLPSLRWTEMRPQFTL